MTEASGTGGAGEGMDGSKIAGRTFSTTRRGFDQGEVRGYLDAVAGEVDRLRARIALLESDVVRSEAELRDAQEHPLAPGELDEAAVVAAVGEEMGSTLRNAHAAASDLRRRAAEEAERVLAGATEQAAAAAARVRQAASEESQQLVARARVESEVLRRQADVDRRATVDSARAARERILVDLARRRRVAMAEIEQLSAGRERLLDTYGVVRRTLDEVDGELQRADTEARLAAEGVARRLASQRAVGVDADLDPADLHLPDIHLADMDVADVDPADPPSEPSRTADSAGTADPAGHRPEGGSGQEAAPSGLTAGEEESHRGADSSDATGPLDLREIGQPADAELVAAVPSGRRRSARGDRSTGIFARLRNGHDDPQDLGPRPDHVEPGVRILPAPATGDAAPDTATPGASDTAASDTAAPGAAAPEAGPTVAGEAPDPPASSRPAPFDFQAEEEATAAAAGEDRRPAVPRATGPTSGPSATGAHPREVRALPSNPTPTLEEATEAASSELLAAPPIRSGLARSDDDEVLLQRRDAAIGDVEAGLARRLKRLVQDEHNDLLDRLRGSSGKGAPAAALPPADQQAATWAEVAAPALRQAAVAGRAFAAERLDTDADAGDLDLVADAQVLEAGAVAVGSIVEPMSGRLAELLAEPPDGSPELLAETVGAIYRSARTHVDAAAGDAVTAVFAVATWHAAPAGTLLRWVAEDPAGPCPDCDDDALAGAQRKGEAFPTGQQHPPAHEGCRCLLVPEEG